jgi:Protein of unknown function (DUF3455)
MRTPHRAGRRGRRSRTGPRLLVIGGATVAVVAVGAGLALGLRGNQNPTPPTVGAPAQALPEVVRPPGPGPAPGVAPPVGSQVQDVLRAEGGLAYRCTAGTYTLTHTSLKLYVEHGGFAGTQSGLLSWRFTNGTRVDAAVVAQVPRRDTLSQALFRVIAVHGGGANDRATTFIVRQPSAGGLPPANCTTEGQRVVVPFTARYIFYRSAGPASRPPTMGAPAG